MIEVRLSFETVAEAVAFLATLDGPAEVSTAAEGKPAKRGRGKTKVETEAAGAGAGAAAADPLAGVLAPQAPIFTPPAEQLSAPAPVVATGAATQTPSAVDVKTLIATFTELGKAKGRDAIAKVLAQCGATAVVGPEGVGIPQDKWAEAIDLCKKVLVS